MELEKQVTDLLAEVKTNFGELKTAREKQAEEIKNNGLASAETKTMVEALKERFEKLQTQLDAVDAKTQDPLRPNGTEDKKSIGELVTSDQEFLDRIKGGLHGNKSINLHFLNGMFDGRKTVISTPASGTSGVQPLMRLFPEPLEIAQQELRVRDLLTVKTMTTGNSFDYAYQNTRTNLASPQTEGSAKAESTYGWTSLIGYIRTIAHFTNVTKQALEDIPWMRGAIDGELRYGLLVKEESEILAGDGLGDHINGLITQATAYSSTYNVASDTKLDKVRHMLLQARLAGLGTFGPDGIVMNPRDMHDIELLKTEEGGANKGLYIVGDPKTGPVIKTLWGKPVVESDSISYGHFLVGAFKTAAVLIDRQQVTVDISFEHASNFTSNLATIRAEERIGLAVLRAGAFIYS